MEFSLYLNLTIDKSIDTDKSLEEKINLSCESLAILSLVDYCQLVNNKDFECICFYSSTELLGIISNETDQCHLDTSELSRNLNERFNKNFNFEILDLDDKKNSQKFDSDVLDTNLPSLKRKASNECSIIITGLTSLFRDIIKIADRLRPHLNLNSLLVCKIFYSMFPIQK